MTYPRDLSDTQWEIIKPHFDTKNCGKSRKHSERDCVNAVFYITKTGCQWRFLPKNFPPVFDGAQFLLARQTKRNLGENDA